MRILCVGDSHANPNYLIDMFGVAKKLDCDIVFQVGDFGYWPTTRWGVRFLNEAKNLAQDIPLYWLDGNHEDHEALRALWINDGFNEVRDNVFYCPRGHSWEWDGVKFMSVGGAYSIYSLLIKDHNGKEDAIELRGKADGPREGFFRKLEVLTDDQVALCQAQGKVDVVFAHDVADRMPIDELNPMARPDDKSAAKSKAHRKMVDDAAFTVGDPSLFIHGHYHRPYRRVIDGTEFIGLAHDHWNQKGHAGACYWVVDTADFPKTNSDKEILKLSGQDA